MDKTISMYATFVTNVPEVEEILLQYLEVNLCQK